MVGIAGGVGGAVALGGNGMRYRWVLVSSRSVVMKMRMKNVWVGSVTLR